MELREFGHTSTRFRAIVGLLFVAFVFQASVAARTDSVTADEFNGLPVGLHTLQTGDFSLVDMNPPFFQMVAALPLLWGDFQLPEEDPSAFWFVGYDFMLHNWAVYPSLFIPARCITILVAVLLGAFIFQWARELYGDHAALIALALFAFSPSILAHGHLVTNDVPGALGFTLALYFAWKLLTDPSKKYAVGLGVCLGLAPLLKLSCLLLAPTIVLLVAVHTIREGSSGAARRIGLIGIAAGMALVVINFAYGMIGTLIPIGSIEFEPGGILDSFARSSPEWRLPFPAPLLRSIDLVLTGDNPTEPTYFLAGQLSMTGWWYYHLVSFALKTPIPLLLAGGGAVVIWLRCRSEGLADYCIFLPIACVFAANALSNPLNIGVRHALVVEPLLFIAASPIFAQLFEQARGWSAPRAISTLLLIWYLAGSLWVAPRYLQYFNEAAGGPNGGHRWLIDSNLDWGQDLHRLHEYMIRRGLSSVNLAYFGRVNPGVYGVNFRPIERGRSHGTTVISASLLMGRPYWVWQHIGKLEWAHSEKYTWLQEIEPVDRIGALFIYDLP